MTLEFTRSIAVTGLIAYMTDASVYGGAAPARASLALVALGTFKLSTGDVQYEPTAYLPESVVTFSWDVTGKDGVWEMNFWALPLYEGQVLAEGDVVYDLNGGRVIKKYIAGVLTEIAIASLLTDVNVLHKGQKMLLITTALTIKRDEIELILLEVAKLYQNSICEFHEYNEALKNFNYIRVQRSGAFIHFCRGNYITAQALIETGNTLGASIIEKAVA